MIAKNSKEELILIFALGLVPVLIICISIYIAGNNLIFKTYSEQLTSIAAIQKSRILETLETYKEKTALISSRTQLKRSLKHYLEANWDAPRALIRRILMDAVEAIPDLHSITVLDSKNNYVIRSKNLELESRDDFSKVPAIDSIQYYKVHSDSDNNLYINYLAPLTLEGELIGKLIVTYLAKDIVVITSDYSGLGETGETIIAAKDDNKNAVSLMPARLFSSNRVLSRKISLGEDTAMVDALKRRELNRVTDDSIDYLGNKVLAVRRYIDEVNWGVVVKRNIDEAHSLINQLLYLLLVLCLVATSVFSVIVIKLVKRSQNSSGLQAA